MDKSRLPLCLRAASPARAGAAFVLAAALAAPAVAQEAWDAAAAESARELITQAVSGLAVNGARIEVQIGTPDPRLRLAPCGRTEAFLPPGQRALGRTRVGLRCVDGVARWSITLPVTVALHAPAPVLRQALPAGTRLAAEHFTIAEVDWGAAAPLADPATWAGRELARPLAAGAPVQAADLRQRKWFSAGETVQVVARGAGFSIATDGEALGHGIEGETVRVRTAAGKLLSGRAVGDRRVEVML